MEEAIQHALDKLDTARENLEITVLSEGKSGILGLRTEEARIRVRPLESVPYELSETAAKCKETLELLLYKLGITASVVPHTEPLIEDSDNAIAPITLDIRGEDLGILIGRRGQTLASLQYILRLIVTHETKSWTPVIIDVEGYKQRRYESLQSLALRIADQVKTRKTPFWLEAMPSFERRIIHLTLADHAEVMTSSTGEGESRRVVIAIQE